MDISNTSKVLESIKGQVHLGTETDPSQMLANMKINMERGLPGVRWCKRHDNRLSIAAGGPSLADTYEGLDGYIAAVNGACGFLLERGVVPNACGVLDPGNHMPDLVAADRRVRYFVASICDPGVFDKLISAGCNVVIWHPSGLKEIEDYAKECLPGQWLTIGGATTMGLRWLNLGYVLGFRSFTFHGLDSSFRGASTHAYADRKDAYPPLEINGYKTRLNFMAQVTDMAKLLPRFTNPSPECRVEACDIELVGDGLMQSCWRKWKEAGGAKSTGEAFCSW